MTKEDVQKFALAALLVLVGGIVGFAMGSTVSDFRTGDDGMSVEDIKTSDLITVSSPEAEQVIESPLEVEGEARGLWFFDDGFPARLEVEDEEGDTVLAEGWIEVDGDWMSAEFLSFGGELDFMVDEPTEAVLILERNNPAVLPNVEDEIRITVNLEPGVESEVEENEEGQEEQTEDERENEDESDTETETQELELELDF